MANDFNPEKVREWIDRWTGVRVRKTFYPIVGGHVAVLYLEASENAAQINDLLKQIDDLADVSKRMTWTPTAEPSCRPSVDVRVFVATDVPVE